MMQSGSLAEADLHGLVDDRLESDRRADVLRRLALSPADRAKVEAWQEQNELIRAAFAGIVREPLPAALDLTPSPHLHSIAQSIADADPLSLAAPHSQRVRKAATMLAAGLIIAAGLGGSWLLLDAGDRDTSARDLGATDTVAAALPLRGTLDTLLAERTARAVGDERRQMLATGADQALPTTTIPDLSQAGFTLTSAEHDTAAPASLVFHYRNAGDDQLVLSVARTQDGARTEPTKLGRTYSWHRRDKAYAIAGTVLPDRLREIALSLRDDGQD